MTMILRHFGASLFLGATLLVAPAAHANLIVNGNFEAPVLNSLGNDGRPQWDNYCVVGGCDTGVNSVPGSVIPGWKVVGSAYNLSGFGTGAHVSIVTGALTDGANAFPAVEGVSGQWLDLTGEVTGKRAGVEQTVSLVGGQAYVLSFYVGDIQGGVFGNQSRVDLYLNGALIAPSFVHDTAATTLDWKLFTYEFTPLASGNVAFAFLNGDGQTGTIDNSNGLDQVSLVAKVPEPGAMLLAVFALLAFGLAHRPRPASQRTGRRNAA